MSDKRCELHELYQIDHDGDERLHRELKRNYNQTIDLFEIDTHSFIIDLALEVVSGDSPPEVATNILQQRKQKRMEERREQHLQELAANNSDLEITGTVSSRDDGEVVQKKRKIANQGSSQNSDIIENLMCQEEPADQNFHEEPENLNLHEQPTDQNFLEEQNNLNLDENPDNQNFHEDPENGILYQELEDQNSHNKPKSLNLLEQPEDQNFHEEQKNLNVCENQKFHDQPDNLTLFGEPDDQSLHKKQNNLSEIQNNQNFYVGTNNLNLCKGPEYQNFHEGLENPNLYKEPENQNFHEELRTLNLHEEPEAQNFHIEPESERVCEVLQNEDLHENSNGQNFLENPDQITQQTTELEPVVLFPDAVPSQTLLLPSSPTVGYYADVFPENMTRTNSVSTAPDPNPNSVANEEVHSDSSEELHFEEPIHFHGSQNSYDNNIPSPGYIYLSYEYAENDSDEDYRDNFLSLLEDDEQNRQFLEAHLTSASSDDEGGESLVNLGRASDADVQRMIENVQNCSINVENIMSNNASSQNLLQSASSLPQNRLIQGPSAPPRPATWRNRRPWHFGQGRQARRPQQESMPSELPSLPAGLTYRRVPMPNYYVIADSRENIFMRSPSPPWLVNHVVLNNDILESGALPPANFNNRARENASNIEIQNLRQHPRVYRREPSSSSSSDSELEPPSVFMARNASNQSFAGAEGEDLNDQAAQGAPSASTGAIRKVQSSKSTSTSVNVIGICPICIKSLAKRNVASTWCGHLFCIRCIKKAIITGGKKCPTCRKPLKGKCYHQVYF